MTEKLLTRTYDRKKKMWIKYVNNLSYCCKSIDFERLKASKGIKTLIIAFVSKTGQLVAHYKHRIFSFGVLYQRPNIFRHFTGLTMLRERPFDIYTGQEDVLGLVIFFFTTQSCLFISM